MDETVKKRVDESWKERAEKEKQVPGAQAGQGQPEALAPAERRVSGTEAPEARFDLFISGLGVEALVALGDMPHPTTRKQAANLPHAKYMIDLVGILEEKTKGNLSVEEQQLLRETLYQLRMRYLAKAGG